MDFQKELSNAITKLEILNPKQSIHYIFILLCLFIYMLSNTNTFFNSQLIFIDLISFKIMLITYFILFIFVSLYYKENTIEKEIHHLSHFFIFFFTTYFVIGLIFGLNQFNIFLFLLSFLLSLTEELIFRLLLNDKLGPLISNILFALFHFSLNNTNIITLPIVFLFGLSLYFIREIYSLGGSVGIHSAINMIILSGILL